MRLISLYKLAIAVISAVGMVACQSSDKLVIIHTNDTHSQILPQDDDANLGGAGRRLVLFDSIRAAEPNVIFVDAGDAVQGTLFFNLYGGVVEQKVMNELGYDIRILGNHEFDNGVDSLAKVLSHSDAEFICTNYNFSKTALAGRFVKSVVREYGNRKVGFIGINLRPEGMIALGNYDGVEFSDIVKNANDAAHKLKQQDGCDIVVAITHIGYESSQLCGDVDLASQSTDIDIIIGGHSHDVIDPNNSDNSMQWMIPNKVGKNVLITQTGKAGRNIGKITIDLNTLESDYELITVDERLDSRIPEEFNAMLMPYCAGVDSLMKVPVGVSALELDQKGQELLNWCTDVVYDRGCQLADGVDLAIFNKGGIRRGLPKGTITEGQVISMVPFSNYIQVIDISGADLLEAMRQMARAEGNGVSDGVEIVYIKDDKSTEVDEADIVSVTINGKPLDVKRTYRVATIDYVANGGDYMSTMRNHTLVSQSENKAFDDVLNYLRVGGGKDKSINPSSVERMHTK